MIEAARGLSSVVKFGYDGTCAAYMLGERVDPIIVCCTDGELTWQ
jgi:hypothetical protein